MYGDRIMVSQSTICRFEKLEITAQQVIIKSVQRIQIRKEMYKYYQYLFLRWLGDFDIRKIYFTVFIKNYRKNLCYRVMIFLQP